MRRLRLALSSNSAVLVETSPRTIDFPFGTKRSGEKSPARGESYSRKKKSIRNALNSFSATAS
jgi:hypothetical protein